MRKTVISLVALALALGATTAHALGEGEIIVTGTGTVWAEPDQAVVELGWSGVDAEVGEAVAQGNAAIAAIRGAAEALGIDPLDVRTTGFFVWREERWDERGEPRMVGYRVSHTLQVVVRDVDTVGALITVATEAGANQVGGITFTVADREAIEQEARAAAFAAAHQRARELAELAGRTLGPAARIEEVSRGTPGLMESTLDMGGRGGAPVAAGRHAVEVVVRVTFTSAD